MAKTKIEWLLGGDTINPITGCSGPPGGRCPWCYAHRMARRLANIRGTVYERVALATRVSPFVPALHLDVLERESARLAKAKPRRVFIGSMADVCSDGLWAVWNQNGERDGMAMGSYVQDALAQFCANLPQHTFLLLTKRPERLLPEWPSNVHVGVSASTFGEARDRMAALSSIKCGLRWVSMEPWDDDDDDDGPVTGFQQPLPGVQWVVLGGWSGGKPLRPGVLNSARRIVKACKTLGIPVFVKDNMRQADPRSDWPMEIPK